MTYLKIPLFLFLTVFLSQIVLEDVWAQVEEQPVTVDDFFDLKYVSNPLISPDGEWVAYTVRQTDFDEGSSETRLWMTPVNGGDHLPMSAKNTSVSSPQWSPDGKYLSFMASRNGGETQLWALDRRGGEAQQMTSIEQGISGYEWSPNGNKLLLMIRDKKEHESEDPEPYVIDRLQFKRDYQGYLDRRRTHIYTFTPGDSAAVQLTFGDFDHSGATWSPDGSKIAFVSNRTEEPDGNMNSNIWVVDGSLGEKEGGLLQITQNEGSDSSPVWSPDGTKITYITTREPEKIWYATNHLAITSSEENGQETLLTEEIDRNISRPTFSNDGEQVWFILEEKAERKLASIKSNGADFRIEIEGGLTINNYDIDGSLIALQKGRFNEPDEIFVYQNGQEQQVTFKNKAFLHRTFQPEVEEILFPSADGTRVHGFLVKPINYIPEETYPTILWLHGGPVAQFDHSYSFEPQLFAANGYAVIMVNPRGSSGYGQEFSEVLFADWGNKDFEDVQAAVDYAIDEGVADSERLGVGGWSYGGILTNYVITKSNRFKGAISGASETLYRSNYGHDHYQLHWELELGLPWETPEKWDRISPFNDVANVTTPTLWMGGANDWNVPILGSEQMYQAMKRLGVETQLVVYPGEHHGIRKPIFQKDRYQRYLQWFDLYVKKLEN